MEARQVKAALSAMRNKTDKNDARGIAQLLRTGWYSPVHIKSMQSHHIRMLLTSRKAVLDKCIDLEQEVFAFLCGHGVKLERLLLVRTQCEKESLWACEQALRSGRGGALLAWPERIAFTRLRRLQLAAADHAKLVFLYRPESALREASPAALRLHLEPGDEFGARVRIIKCRGGHLPAPLQLPQPFATTVPLPFPATLSPQSLRQPANAATRPPAPASVN